MIIYSASFANIRPQPTLYTFTYPSLVTSSPKKKQRSTRKPTRKAAQREGSIEDPEPSPHSLHGEAHELRAAVDCHHW